MTELDFLTVSLFLPTDDQECWRVVDSCWLGSSESMEETLVVMTHAIRWKMMMKSQEQCT